MKKLKINKSSDSIGIESHNTGVRYLEFDVVYNGKKDLVSWCSDWPYSYEPYEGNFDDSDMEVIKLEIEKLIK